MKRRRSEWNRQKLTDEQVARIRRDYKPWQVTQAQLALREGVSQPHVHRIVTGKSWPRLTTRPRRK